MDEENNIHTKIHDKNMLQFSELIKAVQLNDSDNVNLNMNDEEFSKIIERLKADGHLLNSIRQQFSEHQIESENINSKIAELFHQNQLFNNLQEKVQSTQIEFQNISEKYENQIKENKIIQKQNFTHLQTIKILKMRLSMLIKAVNGEIIEDNSFDPTSLNIDEFSNIVNQAYRDHDIANSMQTMFPTESKTSLDIANKITDLKSLVSSLSIELDDRNKIHNELLEKEKENLNQIENLNEKLNKKENEYNQLNQNYEKACEENAKLNETLKSQSQENSNLNEMLNLKSKEYEQLNETYENKCKEYEKLNEAYDNKCKEYEQLNQTHENKCKEYEQLNETYGNKCKEYEKLNEGMNSKSNEFENIKFTLDSLINAIDDKLNSSTVDSSILSSLIQKVKKDSDISNAIQLLFPENSENGSAISNKINELNQQIVELNQKVNELNQQIMDLQKNIEIVNEKLKNEKDSHENEVNNLQKQRKDLIKSIDGEDQEISDQTVIEMCQKAEHLNDLYKSIKKKFPDNSNNGEQIEQKVDEFEETIQNLNEANKTTNEKIHQLENQLNSIKIENEQIIQNQKEEIERLKRQLDEFANLIQNDSLTYEQILSTMKTELEIASCVHSIFPDNSNTSEQVSESIKQLQIQLTKTSDRLAQLLSIIQSNQRGELNDDEFNDIISKTKMAIELSQTIQEVLHLNPNDCESVKSKINELVNEKAKHENETENSQQNSISENENSQQTNPNSNENTGPNSLNPNENNQNQNLTSNENENDLNTINQGSIDNQIIERHVSLPENQTQPNEEKKFIEIEIDIEDITGNEIEEEESDDEANGNQIQERTIDLNQNEFTDKLELIVSTVKGETVSIDSIDNDEFSNVIKTIQLNKEISNAVNETIPESCDCYQSVKTHLNQLIESVNQKEMENNELKQKIDEFNQINIQSKLDESIKENEFNKLKTVMENQLNEMKQMHENQLKEINESKEKELNEVKTQLTNTMNELQAINDNQLKELNDIKANNNNQSKQLNELQIELNDKSLQLNEMKQLTEKQSNELNEMKQLNEKQSNELNEMKQLNEKQSNEINEMKQLNENQSNELNEIKALNQKQSNELSEMQQSTELSEMKQLNESQSTELSKLKASNEKQSNELNRLNRELNNQSNELIQMKHLNEKQSNELNSIKNELQHAKSQLESFQKSFESTNQIPINNQNEREIHINQNQIQNEQDMQTSQNQIQKDIQIDQINDEQIPFMLKQIDISTLLNEINDQEIKNQFMILVNAINGQLDKTQFNKSKQNDEFTKLIKKTILIEDLARSAQQALPYDCINGDKLKRKIDVLISIKNRFGEQSNQCIELQNKVKQYHQQMKSKQQYKELSTLRNQLLSLIKVIQGSALNDLSQIDFDEVIKKAKENEDLARSIKEVLPDDSHSGQELKSKIEFLMSDRKYEELEMQLSQKEIELENAKNELGLLEKELETLKSNEGDDHMSEQIQQLESQLKEQFEKQKELEEKLLQQLSTTSEVQTREIDINEIEEEEEDENPRYELLLKAVQGENNVKSRISDNEFEQIVDKANKDRDISNAVQKILPKDSKDGKTIGRKINEIQNRSNVLSKKIRYLHFINITSLIIICIFISVFFST